MFLVIDTCKSRKAKIILCNYKSNNKLVATFSYFEMVRYIISRIFFSSIFIGEYRKHGFIKVGEKIRDIRDIRVFDLAISRWYLMNKNYATLEPGKTIKLG